MPGTGAAASYGDLLLTSILVLAAVCVAAFVVVRLVGRFLATGRVRGAHLLDVVARLPLEPRRSLYVVEVAGKTLLVGTSEMGLSVLSELDGGEVRARAVPRASFGDLVRAAWSRHGRTPDTSVDPGAGASGTHAGANVSVETPGRGADAPVGRVTHVGASVSAETPGRTSDAAVDHAGDTRSAPDPREVP